MAKKKKMLKKVPTMLEISKKVRGNLIPSPKPIRTEKDKLRDNRSLRKSQWRKEVNY